MSEAPFHTSVLSRAQPTDVRLDPFPHLVIKNALPEDIADRLAVEFPSTETFTTLAMQRKPDFSADSSNRRVDISAADIDSGIGVPDIWRKIITHHTSPHFLADFARVFGAAIKQCYPEMEREHGPLADMRVAMTDRDEGTNAQVLLNASLGINTPVTREETRVRGVHIDRMDEIFAGLLYLRDPADDSAGGAFEIHKFKGRRAFLKNEVPPNLSQKIAEVEYEHNTFVIFLNSIDSLHAVSPRSLTPFARRFMIVSGIFSEALIDHSRYQIGAKPTGPRGATTDMPLKAVAYQRLLRTFRNLVRTGR